VWLHISSHFLLLLAEADPDPEPDPPPTNASINLLVDVPGSYVWNSPRKKRFSASHPDGFSDGFVEFYMSDELVRSIDADGEVGAVLVTPYQHGPFDLDSRPEFASDALSG